MAPPTQKQIREPPQIYQNVILGNWAIEKDFAPWSQQFLALSWTEVNL